MSNERDYPLATKAVLVMDDAISLNGDGILGNINLGVQIASDSEVKAVREEQFNAALAYFKAKRIAEMRKS